MRTYLKSFALFFVMAVLSAASFGDNSQTTNSQIMPPPDKNAKSELKRTDSVANAEQEREIRKLIEQLVFVDKPASGMPPISPGMANESEDDRKRFESCQKAFKKLSDYKQLAFPFLIEHLGDNRQSVPFRNHFMDSSVGAACYWNIYFQLQDQPGEYSEYGCCRKGCDGESHSKPYWVGTPFDEAGGLVKWLEENKELTYAEKQIKCLRWLLEKEKEIGTCDAEDSYFVNILPLEIRILERRQEAGEDVADELGKMRQIQLQMLADQIRVLERRQEAGERVSEELEDLRKLQYRKLGNKKPLGVAEGS